MELWVTERQTPTHAISMRSTATLESMQTPYQHLAVVDTEQWGRMLVLDGMVMTTERDEFVYHEMMVHPALSTHPHPRDVLVVGGGDGGVIREVLRHRSVQRAVLVEIDAEVLRVSQKHLPSIACALDDARVHVICGDGYAHIAEHRDAYDVILVDSTEPVGPAVSLFTKGFYQGIFEALRDDGLFVAQSDNPWFKADLIRTVTRDVAAIFPIMQLYTAHIPTYPSGLWTFTMGSKVHDPRAVDARHIAVQGTKYYAPSLHHAAFALPKFVADLVARDA
ncbi:MAG: polyamine aminopropyltransferase [Paenibacillaceae bacterium]|nr:polyamine aminopropyltransferase [Paenibacillaceae bacterium]